MLGLRTSPTGQKTLHFPDVNCGFLSRNLQLEDSRRAKVRGNWNWESLVAPCPTPLTMGRVFSPFISLSFFKPQYGWRQEHTHPHLGLGFSVCQRIALALVMNILILMCMQTLWTRVETFTLLITIIICYKRCRTLKLSPSAQFLPSPEIHNSRNSVPLPIIMWKPTQYW